MPRIQAAFVCESFKKEPSGFLSFHSVVQTITVPAVPASFDEAGLGILVTDLPTNRDSTVDITFLGPNNTFIQLDGGLKASIPLKAGKDGFAQIAYHLRKLVIPAYGAYRFVFSFDGSDEIVHYAPLVVRRSTTPPEHTSWMKQTRH
jgi:hypothetical protein